MNTFLIATGIVALAEIGDKTQLLAFLLATRFKKPIPIIFGIFVATIANHALAGGVGAWLGHYLNNQWMTYILAASFVLMGIWMLIPDKLDDEDVTAKFGVFVTTVVTFFLAEMGDKTQAATVLLAVDNNYFSVVCGTTLGMMLANVPAVYAGDKLAQKIPVKLVHTIAAIIFIVMAVVTLVYPNL